MIVDHRTYRIKAGHTQTHLKIYEEYGFKAQTRHLGQPIAYMFAETGDVNTVVHNWAYEDAADRAKRRSRRFTRAPPLAVRLSVKAGLPCVAPGRSHPAARAPRVPQLDAATTTARASPIDDLPDQMTGSRCHVSSPSVVANSRRRACNASLLLRPWR